MSENSHPDLEWLWDESEPAEFEEGSMSENSRSDLERWLDAATRGLGRHAADSLRAELRAHFQDAVDEGLAAGAAPDEAARRALLELGDATEVARRLRRAHPARCRLGLAVAAGLAALLVLFGLLGLRRQGLPVQATATASLAAAASPPAWQTYTVRPGDTLFRVACRHGVAASAIATANELAVVQVLRPGDRLIIPDADAPTPDVLWLRFERIPGATAPADRSLWIDERLVVRVAECSEDGAEPRSP